MTPRERVVRVLERRRFANTDVLLRESGVSRQFLFNLLSEGAISTIPGRGRGQLSTWTLPLTATLLADLADQERAKHTEL